MANQKEVGTSEGHMKVAESDKDKKGDRTSTESKKISMLQICEVLLLAPVMVIIVVLFLIPTILYSMPPSIQVRAMQ